MPVSNVLRSLLTLGPAALVLAACQPASEPVAKRGRQAAPPHVAALEAPGTVIDPDHIPRSSTGTSGPAINSENYASLEGFGGAEMARAFVAAYGRASPLVVRGEDFEEGGAYDRFEAPPGTRITPLVLFRLNDSTWVLISQAIFAESICATFGGELQVYYLGQEAGRFVVKSRLLDAKGGQYCAGMADWSIRYDLEPNPVIWTDRTYAHMGTLQRTHDIVSLGPERPEQRGGVQSRIAYFPHEEDYDTGKPECDIRGDIIPNPARGEFYIRYTGRASKVVDFVKSDGRYFPVRFEGKEAAAMVFRPKPREGYVPADPARLDRILASCPKLSSSI